MPAVVEITVTIEDGSPVCDELRFKRAKDGPPITSAVHIPGQLLDWVLAEAGRLETARA